MAATPEAWVKKIIKDILARAGVYYHMVVQNGMGKPSLDFIVCDRGIFLAVEAKAPGKEPTPRQAQTVAEIEKSNGDVWVIRSWIDVIGFANRMLATRGEVPQGVLDKYGRWWTNASRKS